MRVFASLHHRHGVLGLKHLRSIGVLALLHLHEILVRLHFLGILVLGLKHLDRIKIRGLLPSSVAIRKSRLLTLPRGGLRTRSRHLEWTWDSVADTANADVDASRGLQ